MNFSRVAAFGKLGEGRVKVTHLENNDLLKKNNGFQRSLFSWDWDSLCVVSTLFRSLFLSLPLFSLFFSVAAKCT